MVSPKNPATRERSVPKTQPFYQIVICTRNAAGSDVVHLKQRVTTFTPITVVGMRVGFYVTP